jgi:hypothetical protein
MTREYFDIILQRLINVLMQEKNFSDVFFEDLTHYTHIEKIKN